MLTREEITPVIVRLFLRYNSRTGVLTWKHRARKYFDSDRAWAMWNAKYAGKSAMTGKSKQGYLKGTICGHWFLAHVVCWAHKTGKWPSGEIDHWHGDRSNNRFANLRDVSQFINQRNAKMQSNNTSGHCGVSFHKQTGRWQAYVTAGSGREYLGLYCEKSDAIEARKEAEVGRGFGPMHGANI